MQRYAGVYLLQNYSTCFRCLSHPSSGVHQTVTAASGTGHSVRATVLCTPDDWCDRHPKHVEWFSSKLTPAYCCISLEIINVVTMHETMHIKFYIYIYTGCPRRNVSDFGRVFLMLKYTDITQNTYIQSWTVTEIMAREVWNFDSCYTLIDYQIHIKTGRNMLFL